MLKYKPILFSTEMVQAILDGRKTVTRRIIKSQPGNAFDCSGHEFKYDGTGFICSHCGYGVSPPHSKYAVGSSFIRPPYKVGDILYVRETWQCFNPYSDKEYVYKATNDCSDVTNMKWLPSIHMPKEAARIFLKVTDVRVERLQYITEMQVRKEGFRDYLAADDIFYPCGYYFRQTWDSTINKQDLDKYGWEANPWVWVIEFERCEREGD